MKKTSKDSRASAQDSKNATSLPDGLRLNIGSGKDWRADFINADIQPEKNPDWVLDITNVPWGQSISTRLGKFKVERESFSVILANDVLEHIPDLVKAMTNCKDLLKTGGQMHIHVPYDLSRGAWQDPTHVRAFNENSWLYYTDWHWYLNWKDRFTLTSLVFHKNPDIECPDELLTMTPRAIDSMSVVLTKD